MGITVGEIGPGVRYRVVGGRRIHVVGQVVGTRLTSVCRRDSRYRAERSDEWRGVTVADPMHIARWPMCPRCEEGS